jgi:hypothetical protein
MILSSVGVAATRITANASPEGKLSSVSETEEEYGQKA